MAYTSDLKSDSERNEGSNPSSRTNFYPSWVYENSTKQALTHIRKPGSKTISVLSISHEHYFNNSEHCETLNLCPRCVELANAYGQRQTDKADKVGK